MRNRAGRALAMVAGLLIGLAPLLAEAAPSKLSVVVAKVSKKGNEVDPPLKQFAEDFKDTLIFTTFKVIEVKNVSLEKNQSATIPLPGGKKVNLKLLEQKPDGSVSVKVDVPPLSLTPEIKKGSYIPMDAGSLGKDKLFVVVKNG